MDPVAATVSVLLLLLVITSPCSGNEHAKRLYEYLLREQGYNSIVRPVSNRTDKINVTLGLKLSQLIDVVGRYSITTYTTQYY